MHGNRIVKNVLNTNQFIRIYIKPVLGKHNWNSIYCIKKVSHFAKTEYRTCQRSYEIRINWK